MAERISARRAKIQENQARKQIFWAVILTGVLGLVFLFVFIPLLFRGVILLAGRSGQPVSDPSDTIPPQVPAFPAIAPYLSNSKVEINGFTEPKATVYLILDEQEAGKTTAQDDGSFLFTTDLAEGEHTLYLYSEDASGNTSQNSPRYTTSVDKTAPTLEVSSPQNSAVFTLRREQTLDVQGKASEEGYVYVNASRIATDSEGKFVSRLQLGEGENTLTLHAEDLAGNSSPETVLSVEYKP
jgi:hypothetical protein